MGFSSARALAMGNAFTAVADDSDAIFYNPSMLAKVDGVHWTIMDPHVGVGPTNVGALTGLSNSSSSSGISSMINPLYGKNLWAGGGGKSSIWLPYLGVAAYANTEAGILASSPPNPRLNMNYFFDYGGAVGMALPIIPSIFATGLTVRSINRTGTTNTIGPSALTSGNTDNFNSILKSRGNAYAVDFGTMISVPGPISPTLSFVYRDLGVTTFSHDEGAGAPPPVLPEMIIGGSVRFKVPLLEITPAIDYRYVGQNVATGMNLNLGLEISLPFIDLRGGMSQGYYTAGAGLDLGLIRADVATWGVELGAYPGQMVDRRYMAEITIQLGFDPFKFISDASGKSGNSGERRHLKQRR